MLWSSPNFSMFFLVFDVVKFVVLTFSHKVLHLRIFIIFNVFLQKFVLKVLWSLTVIFYLQKQELKFFEISFHGWANNAVTNCVENVCDCENFKLKNKIVIRFFRCFVVLHYQMISFTKLRNIFFAISVLTRYLLNNYSVFQSGNRVTYRA
jgi:hypothetical protein